MKARGETSHDLAAFARLLYLAEEEKPVAEAIEHLAALCPACAGLRRQVKALRVRFQHWDPLIYVLQGAEADALFEKLLAQGSGWQEWQDALETSDDWTTWGVAWVALERARKLLAASGASQQAFDFARISHAIAAELGQGYHPEWLEDLRALTAAALVAAAPATAMEPAERLCWIDTAREHVEEGTGRRRVAMQVKRLLARAERPGRRRKALKRRSASAAP